MINTRSACGLLLVLAGLTPALAGVLGVRELIVDNYRIVSACCCGTASSE